MAHRSIFVVGKYSRTPYGPFQSEALAQSFIRVQLGSSTRYYETVSQHSLKGAVPAWAEAATKGATR